MTLCVRDLGDRVVTEGPFIARFKDGSVRNVIHGHRRGGRTWGTLKAYDDGRLSYEATLDSYAPEHASENEFKVYYTKVKAVVWSGSCRGTEVAKFAMYKPDGSPHPDQDAHRSNIGGSFCKTIEEVMSRLRRFP